MDSIAEILRPRLAVRVGITGHRDLPHSSDDQLSDRIRSVLGLVQDCAKKLVERKLPGYTEDPPLLRAISPLAEGADRLFARTAIELGWELQCPLPFERDVYRKDFKGKESSAAFDELVSHPRTTAVVELDGTREEESAAYLAVGRQVLEQCDVLVAVWNGEGPRGQGGTAQVVSEATRQEIPVIWIHSRPPYQARLLLCIESKQGCLIETEALDERLREALADILVLRREGSQVQARAVLEEEDDADTLGEYSWAPRTGSSLLGWIWTRSFGLWSTGRRTRESPTLPDGPYRPLYDRADGAAQYYSGLYRGSFLTNYLLGVCAVFSALLAYAHHSWHTFWILVELTAITAILTLIIVAKARCWHERAIDSRFLAEQLRQMLFLHPLGLVTPSSRPPIHYAFGDPRSTWMNWRFRAFVRQIGMPGPSIRLDAERNFERIRNQWLPSQLHYHQDNSALLHTVEHRLARTVKILFFATIGSCLGHLAISDPAIVPWLTLFSAALPACGAALYAISSHGEFRRLAERSTAMARRLELTTEELDSLARTPQGIKSTDLGRLASEAAQTMIDEVSDWRIVYRKPPLGPA